MRSASPNWSPPVVQCSALKQRGLDELWNHVTDHRDKLTGTGELPEKRVHQQIRWMWSMIDDRLMSALRTHGKVVERIPSVERDVEAGRLTPTLGAQQILNAFGLELDTD